MTRLQKLLVAMLPQRWAENMEAESRTWIIRCPSCSYEISVWEAGGVRWKARGKAWIRIRCPQCGQAGWTQLYRTDQPAA